MAHGHLPQGKHPIDLRKHALKQSIIGALQVAFDDSHRLRSNPKNLAIAVEPSSLTELVGVVKRGFPQFLLGFMGMPRRYHVYPPEFQVLNVLSSAGASVLGIGYLIPFVYLIWSLYYGKKAPANPWGATGLEWTVQSPPIHDNFEVTPVITQEAYQYSKKEEVHVG